MTSLSLRIVLVYSDSSSARLGERVSKHLRSKLSNDFEVAQTSWNAELLRSPKLRQMAAADALQSDVIIIATSESQSLPRDLESWIELWRDKRRDGPAALVAVLNRSERSNRADAVKTSLQRTAERARMEFFCHALKGSEPDSGNHRSRLTRPQTITYRSSDPNTPFEISFVLEEA